MENQLLCHIKTYKFTVTQGTWRRILVQNLEIFHPHSDLYLKYLQENMRVYCEMPQETNKQKILEPSNH